MIALSPSGISLTFVSFQPSVSLPQATSVILLRERAKEEARSPFLCPLNNASLNVPAAGYISDASNASFWNIDYYQHHFDIDTKTVGFFFLPPFFRSVVNPEN